MKKQLESLRSKTLDQILEDPKELRRFYKEFFNEDVCAYCKTIIKQRWEDLIKLTPEKVKAIMTRVLKMKPGKAISTFSSNTLPQGYWTAKNINDAVAIKLIESGHASSFINPQDLQKAKDSITL